MKQRRDAMVSWWWIPIAAWVGCFIGVLVISLCRVCDKNLIK